MRFFAIAFAASALVLGACGGGESNEAGAGDSAAAAAPATGMDSAGATTGAAPAGGGAATAAAVTGTTHEVRMIGDEKGYRFEPANLTVKQGDGVKFIMVSGGPHNVAFDEASLPAGAKDQLNANIPNPAAPLSSQMYMNPNEEVTISFANVAAGTYNYVCTPHQAMGMKGAITVQ